MNNKFVIIVAGGIGLRMGASTPKQFLNLQGIPVLMHTITKYYAYDPYINIILVLPTEHFSTWESLCEKYQFHVKHEIVAGGETRYQSVKNGLASISSEGIVAVHDGVRPLVSKELIELCFKEALKNDNAIPCVEVNETVREIFKDGNKQLNRNNIKLIQTPQVFKTEILKKAYELPFSVEFTDDASVIEKAGFKINLVVGEKSNIKITTEIDLKIAEYLLNIKDK
ncbi:MAG: 2-C-methyl-D-erythritol 4-phosphate cytidylyltransferase [Bacteroidia bacterium]|nr:2-C-methyl-D-erythritol 4-phosphate cytidylyltransferase [Bacteroidia bacterium]